MKQSVRIIAGIIVLSISQGADAARWLVTADLGSRKQIASWSHAGLPANELLGGTAIAVLDDVQLMQAERNGFDPHPVERYDPQAAYLIIDANYPRDGAPGNLLWQQGSSGLYRYDGRPLSVDHQCAAVEMFIAAATILKAGRGRLSAGARYTP